MGSIPHVFREDRPNPNFRVVNQGEVRGISWVTCHAPLFGAINGYVRTPENHPWYGLDYDDIPVDVHGGLTYANRGWIGFDTLHAGDVWPGEFTQRSAMGDPGHLWEAARRRWEDGGYAIHWTPEMVVEETRALVYQVIQAGRGWGRVLGEWRRWKRNWRLRNQRSWKLRLKVTWWRIG